MIVHCCIPADHPCHPINWILAMWCMAVWRHAKLLSLMWDRAPFHSTPPTNTWMGQDSLSTWWPKSGLFLMPRAWSSVFSLTQLRSSALKDRFKHYYLSMWENLHVPFMYALPHRIMNFKVFSFMINNIYSCIHHLAVWWSCIRHSTVGDSDQTFPAPVKIWNQLWDSHLWPV